jgi:HSP20 family molecular chaperone IbpA
VITLPPTVQRDQITAWLKDGVLWLRLPNVAAATVRNVAVS